MRKLMEKMLCRIKSEKTSLYYPLFICMLCLSSCSEDPEKQKIPKPVSTFIISKTASHESRLFSGIVQSADSTELSFEVTGKVEDVFFELGEAFQKSDSLAKLDQTSFLLTVKEREGQVSEAEARLVEAQNDFERKKSLVKGGFVSQSQFDVSKSQFESAQDQLNVAKARLGLAREDLEDTTLRAPYDGRIAVRMVEPSQRVSPNSPVFMIEGNKGLEVSVLVPESLLSSIAIGQKAKIHIPAIKSNFHGTVKEMSSVAQSANSFPTVIEIKNQDITLLKAGMSAEVRFLHDSKTSSEPSTKKQFKIPVSALLARPENKYFVYKVIHVDNKKNPKKMSQNEKMDAKVKDYRQLMMLSVNVLELRDQHAIVIGDMAQGDYIVDAGVGFLRDKQRVSLINNGHDLFNP